MLFCLVVSIRRSRVCFPVPCHALAYLNGLCFFTRPSPHIFLSSVPTLPATSCWCLYSFACVSDHLWYSTPLPFPFAHARASAFEHTCSPTHTTPPHPTHTHTAPTRFPSLFHAFSEYHLSWQRGNHWHGLCIYCVTVCLWFLSVSIIQDRKDFYLFFNVWWGWAGGFGGELFSAAWQIYYPTATHQASIRGVKMGLPYTHLADSQSNMLPLLHFYLFWVLFCCLQFHVVAQLSLYYLFYFYHHQAGTQMNFWFNSISFWLGFWGGFCGCSYHSIPRIVH